MSAIFGVIAFGVIAFVVLFGARVIVPSIVRKRPAASEETGE